jgi:hypothetical protein
MSILYVNGAALTNAITTTIAKDAQINEGVSLIEWSGLRYFTILVCASIGVIMRKKNPIKDIPRHLRWLLFMRTCAGVMSFTVANIGI